MNFIERLSKINIEMFPPNLKKNIREIDRQITLLESECKNMEPEQNESLSTVVLSKVAIRELPSKPFITGPIRSTCSYNLKKYNNISIIKRLTSYLIFHQLNDFF